LSWNFFFGNLFIIWKSIWFMVIKGNMVKND
jgi:hypothetical protein